MNTVHGLYATEDDPWAKRALVGVLEAIASRFSDEELVQNPEDLAWMVRLHVSRARPHPAARQRGRPHRGSIPPASRPTIVPAVRADLGVGPGDVLVGTVGRLVAEKGYPELFEAVASLPERYRLVVVGADDPEKPDALDRDMVDAARARGAQFLGHRDDVDALYAAMDVFVLASHREGFPRAAMEAAAMGVPVVATDIRGCRQVVDDGVNGVLVAVGGRWSWSPPSVHWAMIPSVCAPPASPDGASRSSGSTNAGACRSCSTPTATSPPGRASPGGDGPAGSGVSSRPPDQLALAPAASYFGARDRRRIGQLELELVDPRG